MAACGGGEVRGRQAGADGLGEPGLLGLQLGQAEGGEQGLEGGVAGGIEGARRLQRIPQRMGGEEVEAGEPAFRQRPGRRMGAAGAQQAGQEVGMRADGERPSAGGMGW